MSGRRRGHKTKSRKKKRMVLMLAYGLRLPAFSTQNLSGTQPTTCHYPCHHLWQNSGKSSCSCHFSEISSRRYFLGGTAGNSKTINIIRRSPMDLLAPSCVSTERNPVSKTCFVISKNSFSLCTKQILQCLLIWFSLLVGFTFAIIPTLMHYPPSSSGVCVDHIDHRPD